MQVKINNSGVLLLVNKETGEKIPWEGVTEISDDEEEECESTLVLLRNQKKFAESLQEGLMNALEDDKTPNPNLNRIAAGYEPVMSNAIVVLDEELSKIDTPITVV